MRIFKIVWSGVVIELISSNWKVIATCADWYTTDIFFSCKCVINELTLTRHYCQSSRTHRYSRRQEVNEKKNLTGLPLGGRTPYITSKNRLRTPKLHIRDVPRTSENSLVRPKMDIETSCLQKKPAHIYQIT